MTQAIATRSSWDERLQRAAQLAETYSFAADILNFYREVATFQKSFNGYLHSCDYNIEGPYSRLPEELDTFVVLPKLQPFLQVVENAGPPQLSQSARDFAA